MKQLTLSRILARYLSRRRGLEFSVSDHMLIVRYRAIEIINVVDQSIWIRREMPEDRSKIYVRPEDPRFFQEINRGLNYAKKVVDEVHDVREALEHMGVASQ